VIRIVTRRRGVINPADAAALGGSGVIRDCCHRPRPGGLQWASRFPHARWRRARTATPAGGAQASAAGYSDQQSDDGASNTKRGESSPSHSKMVERAIAHLLGSGPRPGPRPCERPRCDLGSAGGFALQPSPSRRAASARGANPVRARVHRVPRDRPGVDRGRRYARRGLLPPGQTSAPASCSPRSCSWAPSRRPSAPTTSAPSLGSAPTTRCRSSAPSSRPARPGRRCC
jgi:hypothetical protein